MVLVAIKSELDYHLGTLVISRDIDGAEKGYHYCKWLLGIHLSKMESIFEISEGVQEIQ